MSELWCLPAAQIAHRVRGGELHAAEVFESCLGRALEVDPRISAYLEIFAEEGRRRAEDIDRRLAAGERLGALAGVPIAVKDNISIAGHRMTCGSRILEGYVAPYSATIIDRLEKAGAVIMGKTNLDEFAMGSSCENSALQKTFNPWNLAMVPGGSSGGSAAAVAASSVPIALGSETGGSIRQPAALCGVVGLKPTYGRVSRYGLVAFASSTDQIGPLSRNVEDAALVLSILAGRDDRDSTSADRPVDAYLDDLDRGLEGLRVGTIAEIDTASLAEDCRTNWTESLSRLEQLGAELRQVSIPNITASVACYTVLANSEASANLARFDGVRYGRRSRHSTTLLDLYLASRGEGFGAEVKRRIMLGTFALSSGYHEAYYQRAQGVREAMRRQFGAVFEEVDVLVTPTSPTGAFALGSRTANPLAMYLSDVYTAPANLVGCPALAVPSGCDDRGLPLSLQIMARPFEEATLFRVGRAFERSVGFRVEPQFVESTPD